jgi:hypothetical protein
MKFGAGVSGPSADQVRKSRSKKHRENGKYLFSAKRVQAILDAREGVMKVCLLLGISGAFDNLDCATPPISATDPGNAVIDC